MEVDFALVRYHIVSAPSVSNVRLGSTRNRHFSANPTRLRIELASYRLVDNLSASFRAYARFDFDRADCAGVSHSVNGARPLRARKIITTTIRETIIIRTMTVGSVSPLSREIFTPKRPSRVRRTIIIAARAKPTSDVVLRVVAVRWPWCAAGSAGRTKKRSGSILRRLFTRPTIPWAGNQTVKAKLRLDSGLFLFSTDVPNRKARFYFSDKSHPGLTKKKKRS